MDSNEPNGAKLFAKMARIMGELKRLPKTGYNQHFKYAFVTDGDVSDTIRELMAKENIAFFAETVAVEPVNGKKSRAQYVFTFACGDTGATRSCSWFGEADDAQDKGLSKAATSAAKYFLLKTFMISTGDERDDPDAGEQASKSAAKSTQQKAPATNGNGAKAFPTKEAADSFVAHWNATDGLRTDELKLILGVKLFSEYTGTLAQANAVVNERILASVPFGGGK